MEAWAPSFLYLFLCPPCKGPGSALTVHLQEVGLQVRVQAALGQAVAQIPVQGQDIQQNL